MSTSNFPFSTSEQEIPIGASLNTSMLLNFLMGIYTVAYGGTMYLYLSQHAANANRRIVMSAISVLYLLNLIEFIVQWYFLDLQLVINGATRESIFIATLGEGPAWWLVLNVFMSNSLFIVSDALLIWRCFQVWGQSFRAIMVPLILFLAEFCLFIPITVLKGTFIHSRNANTNHILNNLSGAMNFVTLGTTVVTTFLIGYRIHSVSRMNGPPSKRLFNRVVILIIESAAVYSLVLLFDAILVIVPSFSQLDSVMFQANYYVEAVLSIVAGLAPTILVARIIVREPNCTAVPAISHISGLQFGSQIESGRSGNVTVGDVCIRSIQTRDSEPVPMDEKKEFSVHGILGEKQV